MIHESGTDSDDVLLILKILKCGQKWTAGQMDAVHLWKPALVKMSQSYQSPMDSPWGTPLSTHIGLDWVLFHQPKGHNQVYDHNFT